MGDEELLHELPRVAGAFEARLRGSDVAAGVPACPGWTVADLVGHLGRIHEWAAEIVTTGAFAKEASGHPAWSSLDDAADWYAATARRLQDAVASCRLEDPCWNFARVRETKGFWLRRQVHETQVHLLDLAQSAGQEVTLDAELSADGVSEVFEVFTPRMTAKGRPLTLHSPVELAATDVGAVWRLTPDQEASIPLLSRSRATGDDSVDRVEGAAADLLTVLWRRRDADCLKLEGDAERLAAFLGSAFTP